MPRIIIVGLTALTLAMASCKPVAEPAPAPEPAAPITAAAPDAAEAAWVAEQDRYLGVNVQPSDPVEGVVWRGVRCDFLGSEIGGDNSAQDRAIQARMDELRCGDELMAEARALRVTLAGAPDAVRRLDILIGRQSG